MRIIHHPKVTAAEMERAIHDAVGIQPSMWQTDKVQSVSHHALGEGWYDLVIVVVPLTMGDSPRR